MPKALVDANKYLEFYQSVPIGQLAPLLSALGDHLFVTRQIVDEVVRNRVSLAQQFLTQSWQKKPLHYSLPMHLMSGEKGKLEEIGKRITEANNKSTALHRELDAIFTATLHDIAAGRDPISLQLAPIFEKAVKPSLGDAGRARSRKERGNPPGKRTDPLGDQLTWEQFLSAIKGEPLVWIITGDGDYRYEMPDKQLVLNPILLNDVLAATETKTEVRCFKTLAEGLKDALDTLKLQPAKKLSAEEIAVIRDAELENAKKARTPAVICPACGAATTWRKIQAVQGYMGGIVFFTCPTCGAQFDTE